MELESSGDPTLRGTRLPTSSREAINMAIHYVLAEIVMSYESGNASVTWSIAGKNLDALHRLMLMCIQCSPIEV